MRCSNAQSMIILKLDKELRARYSASLEKHLAACSACRLFREEMLSQNSRFASLSQPAVAPWIHSRILDQAAAHDNRRLRSRMIFQLEKIPALAAVLLSLYIGTLVGIKTHNSTSASASAQISSGQTTEVASFGENSLVDESYNNGGSDE